MAVLAVIFVAVVPPGAPKGALRPFSKVDNREVFMRTIELYTNRDAVQQRVLVVGPDDLATMQAKYSAHLGFQGVSVTVGGSDWFSAVARGLEKLKPEIDTVIVHDACRPAVPYTLLDALDNAVGKTGAAAPVLAISGSFARLNGDRTLDAAVDLGGLHEVQTPQIFGRKVLGSAYANRGSFKGHLADDAALVRSNGGVVATVPGSRYNVRIDSEDAVKLAGDFLKHLPRPKSKTPLTPFDEAQW
jgi:2-C-methyl-D-erythritol 4-phosphate cytidylyltransferase